MFVVVEVLSVVAGRHSDKSRFQSVPIGTKERKRKEGNESVSTKTSWPAVDRN